MILRFQQAYKSIRNLADTELPNFCVLTGVNGAGKTHLLEAIENGSVIIDEVADRQQIRRFDWTTFALQIADAASPSAMRQQRATALSQISAAIESQRNDVSNVVKNHGVIASDELADGRWLLRASVEDMIAALEKARRSSGAAISTIEASAIASAVLQHRITVENNLQNFAPHLAGAFALLRKFARGRQRHVLSLTTEEIRDAMPLTWAANEALQFQLAQWFAAWHAAFEYNRMNRFYATTEGDSHRAYVSDEDFRKRFGPEPWNLTNDILRTAGVRYTFNQPSRTLESIEQNFDLRLIDPDDGSEIRLNELSSGERVLLAITLLLFQSKGDDALMRMPALLLLDEVDAPLHPSFTRILIDVLFRKLVGECSLKVLLTTHAPATVALSPPNHVYELVRRPRSIRRVTRSEATQILSSGYISITPADIVVITESSADPEYYQNAYASLTRLGKCGDVPPLKFISASHRKDDGIGGGCAQVREWASKLHQLGLDRFRGLVDRDAGVQENDVVKVLRRDAVENYIYDPLTLSAFAVHRGAAELFTANPPQRPNGAELLNIDAKALQQLVKDFTAWLASLAGDSRIHDGEHIVHYLGFPSLTISPWWVNTDGHELEKLLKRALNPATEKRSYGPLIKKDRADIITFQTRTLPELLAIDLPEIFAALQKTVQ